MRRRRPDLVDELDRAALRLIGDILALGLPPAAKRKYLAALKKLNRGYTDAPPSDWLERLADLDQVDECDDDEELYSD